MSLSAHARLILGVDPGLRRTGWGVIRKEGSRLSYVASGVILPPVKEALPARLAYVFEQLMAVFDTHQPHEAAVEETFVNVSARDTLKLGQARGVALLVPALKGLEVGEYAPNKIKKAVVGAGHAEKEQIRMMVKVLLPRAHFQLDDEADALAVAICHAHHSHHIPS